MENLHDRRKKNLHLVRMTPKTVSKIAEYLV
jgi:hypothetical protein